MLLENIKLDFGTVNQLCSDVILGHPFLRQHSDVSFQMGGPENPFKILKQDNCLAVAAAKAKALCLFQFLADECTLSQQNLASTVLMTKNLLLMKSSKC